jgi:very long chain acyl-CoA dehydrogenase
LVPGLQYAGGHLRELQKAVKDPISNFGVVLGEVTKRGRSVVGLGGGNTLASHVHPNLADVSAGLCRNVEMFGGAVEKVLIKHGEPDLVP